MTSAVMATTESVDICFEGWLEKIQSRSRKDKQWCILYGHSLEFYKAKRTSCLYSIELSKLKAVTNISHTDYRFEVQTDRKYVYSTESEELCSQWIAHIQAAFEAVTVPNNEIVPQQPSVRRGSLPQQNTVTEALRRHSSNRTEQSSNRFSGASDAGTESSLKRNSSGRSKVKDLAMRFSGTEQTPSKKSPTSPIKSPTSPIMHSISQTRHNGLSSLSTEKDISESNINLTETEKENQDRDSGYSTQLDVIDGHNEEKSTQENTQNNDDSQVKGEGSNEDEPVVLRRPGETSVSIPVVEDEEEDSADDIDEGTDLDNLLQLQFEPLTDDLPHPKSDYVSMVTELKDLLLEVGGTDLDGRFVQKDIDVHDAKPIQELTSFLKTL